MNLHEIPAFTPNFSIKLICCVPELVMMLYVMRRRLRQNATNVSEIYIGRPIYISDVQYIYPTSDIYIRHRVPISDIRVPISDIRVPISDVRYTIPDLDADIDIGRLIYIYWTSDIYIGRPIYILDIRYRFLKHW